jgi:hypothetical protein
MLARDALEFVDPLCHSKTEEIPECLFVHNARTNWMDRPSKRLAVRQCPSPHNWDILEKALKRHPAPRLVAIQFLACPLLKLLGINNLR